MKGNKRTMLRTNRAATKQNDIIKEMYNLLESRSGNTPNEARLTPREFGKQLASDLIEKIDKEVTVK
jgi:hypothetical protein